ncbi:hypothetical protein [Terrihabitans sp. B22-R8]|uniref:hypothetical protein n=1 Tax=Terrihabitans sp. B22-R8 TaxID=3425128 RepID=UPI00403D0F64
MRRLVLAALVLLPVTAHAQQQTLADLAQNGRYQLLELNDQVIRLDAHTGVFDLCGLRGGKWDCQVTTDRANAQADAIKALTARVDALEKERAEEKAAAEKAKNEGLMGRITGYIPGMGK